MNLKKDNLLDLIILQAGVDYLPFLATPDISGEIARIANQKERYAAVQMAESTGLPPAAPSNYTAAHVQAYVRRYHPVKVQK